MKSLRLAILFYALRVNLLAVCLTLWTGYIGLAWAQNWDWQPSSFEATLAKQALSGISQRGLIVFTRNSAASEKEEGREIFLLNPASGDLKRLTNDNYWDNQANLSPDGTKIVFESAREDLNGDGKLTEDDRDIYVMALKDLIPLKVLNNRKFKGHPEWSPNGSQILFLMKDDSPYKTDIYVINADGTGLTRLTSTGDCVDPTWSPDGKKIAYVKFKPQLFVDITKLETELWIMDSSGSQPKKVLNSEFVPKHGNFKHSIFDPAWSPDGKWLAFSRRVSDRGNYGLGVWHIYIVSLDGTQIKDLNDDESLYGFPQWTPHPSWLLGWGFSQKNGTRPHLMIFNKDTREKRDLTNNPEFHDEMPYWR